jgi:hypothetical protein
MWPGFQPRSGHVQFVVDKVALGHVSSEYFGFPCQFLFHRLLHTHQLSSVDGTIGQVMTDVPSGLSLTPPQETKKKIYPHALGSFSSPLHIAGIQWRYYKPLPHGEPAVMIIINIQVLIFCEEEDSWRSRKAPQIRIREILGLTLGRDTRSPYWGVSHFISVLHGKSRNNTSIKPKSFSSKFFPIRHSSYIRPFNSM